MTTERLYGKDGDHVKLNRIDNKWIYASRKDVPVADGNHKPDAVVVIATDKHGRLLVIKEKRPIVGDYIWSFPAGLVDPDETIFEAAEREVAEETGMKLLYRPNVDFHTFNTFSSPGITDEKVAVITGEVEGELSTDGQEKDEDIQAFLMTPDDMVAARLYDPNTPMSIWLFLALI